MLAYRLFFCESMEEREWILDYLASGKGTIPYQTITDLDSLSKRPPCDSDFFDKESFYSTLREKNISEEEYKMLKIFLRYWNWRHWVTWTEFTTYKTLWFCVKFLNKDLNCCKSFLNLIRENVRVPLPFLVTYIETKASVILYCPSTLK